METETEMEMLIVAGVTYLHYFGWFGWFGFGLLSVCMGFWSGLVWSVSASASVSVSGWWVDGCGGCDTFVT
jgi:hypothetical protein